MPRYGITSHAKEDNPIPLKLEVVFKSRFIQKLFSLWFAVKDVVVIYSVYSHHSEGNSGEAYIATQGWPPNRSGFC